MGSLRHSMLRAAGAPTVESEIVSDTRMMTGTMWHDFFEKVLRGQPVMCEVQLDRWLPEGWSGRADWISWSDEYKAFVLGDLKTTKGESMRYMEREGIKAEHMWQLSSYWYALKQMGLKVVKGFYVLYLPMNNVPGEVTAPLICEGMPLDEDLVLGTMENRWRKTQQYLWQVNDEMLNTTAPVPEVYVNEFLVPVQERVMAVRWNADKFEVKLVPHWSAQFCPYPPELCDCSTQGITKIGHYTAEKYIPRKGYEKITPPALTTQQKEKLDAASNQAGKSD